VAALATVGAIPTTVAASTTTVVVIPADRRWQKGRPCISAGDAEI
jgi:hypothetical protein